MAIENGDFVKIEFTGKVEETGEVFDTTSQDVAEEAGLFNQEKNYGPIPIVVGGKHLLPAIDEAVIGMEKGDSKNVTVDPDNGFGHRDSSLVQLIPMKEFKKQGMTPYPGMKITAEGQTGKILTVNGGRVKVDFNHELAGKTLNYDLTIADIVEDETEKVKSMIALHYAYPNMDIDKTEIEFDGDTIKIKLDEITHFDQKSYMDITFARYRISKDLYENMPYDKVQFVDEFEKRAAEEETEEEVAEETEE
jgi:FKBP-type peptidyl-prolyl cis-trans isomerase 2